MVEAVVVILHMEVEHRHPQMVTVDMGVEVVRHLPMVVAVVVVDMEVVPPLMVVAVVVVDMEVMGAAVVVVVDMEVMVVAVVVVDMGVVVDTLQEVTHRLNLPCQVNMEQDMVQVQHSNQSTGIYQS